MTRDPRIEPSASGFLRNATIDSRWLRCNKHGLQMSQKPARSDESSALPGRVLKQNVVHWGRDAGNPGMFFSFKTQVKEGHVSSCDWMFSQREEGRNRSRSVLVTHPLTHYSSPVPPPSPHTDAQYGLYLQAGICSVIVSTRWWNCSLSWILT